MTAMARIRSSRRPLFRSCLGNMSTEAVTRHSTQTNCGPEGAGKRGHCLLAPQPHAGPQSAGGPELGCGQPCLSHVSTTKGPSREGWLGGAGRPEGLGGRVHICGRVRPGGAKQVAPPGRGGRASPDQPQGQAPDAGARAGKSGRGTARSGRLWRRTQKLVRGSQGGGGRGRGRTWLSSPRKMSMMKKRQDHSWDRGIMLTALGKAMKARPGPAGHTLHQGPAPVCARACAPAFMCACVRARLRARAGSRGQADSSAALGSTLSTRAPVLPSVPASLLPPLVLGFCSMPSTAA